MTREQQLEQTLLHLESRVAMECQACSYERDMLAGQKGAASLRERNYGGHMMSAKIYTLVSSAIDSLGIERPDAPEDGEAA